MIGIVIIILLISLLIDSILLDQTIKSKGFIESYDGTLRILLNEDVSDSVKIAKARLLFRDFIVLS